MTPVLIAIVVVAVAALAASRRIRPRRSTGAPDLRSAVLRGELLRRDGAPVGSAALMDWNVGNGSATLAVFNDGTVSLYFQGGAGIIGAGAHDSVRAPGSRFLEVLSQTASVLTPASDIPLPGAGQTAFWLVTSSGTVGSGAVATADLMNPAHPLHAPHEQAQATITAIRQQQGS